MGDKKAAWDPWQRGGYEVRARWGLDRTWRTGVAAAAAVAQGLIGPGLWHIVGWSSCASGAWAVVLAVSDHVRLRRLGCLLRIDGSGLTVRGGPTIPWSDVRKAEVGRWGTVVFFSWGADGSLPLLEYDSLSRAGERRRRKRLTARFGSPMVLPTRRYGVRPAEVMAAVHTYDGRASLFR